MKNICLTLFLTLTCAVSFAESTDSNNVKISGFECANNSLNAIDLLGRGLEFPGFIVQDVANELIRQQAGSVLLSVRCIGEPELKAASLPDPENPGKSMLSKLSMSFPLDIQVQANKQTKMQLEVKQSYLAENLETDKQRKVTQHFAVISSKTI